MSFNIEQFYSTIKNNGGLVPKNKYKVFLYPPAGFSASANDKELFTLLCQSINLPGKATNTFEYGAGSALLSKYPQGTSYDNLTATFWLTGNSSGYDMISRWMEKSFSSKNYVVSFKDSISGQMTVKGYNQVDEEVLFRKFFDVYPIAISGLNYSSEETNSIHTFDVNFTYKYWTSDPNDYGYAPAGASPF